MDLYVCYLIEMQCDIRAKSLLIEIKVKHFIANIPVYEFFFVLVY